MTRMNCVLYNVFRICAPAILIAFIAVGTVSAQSNPVVNVQNVSCFGGNDAEIEVNVSGPGPYIYRLRYDFGDGSFNDLGIVNTGATTVTFRIGNGTLTSDALGIPANTPPLESYVITVFYNCVGIGCTRSVTRVVTQPDEITATLDVPIEPDCGTGTGSILLTTAGGTAPYTYLWSDGATTEDRDPISSGTYTLTVTDANDCTEDFTFNVPITTMADAGTPDLVCGTNSYVLSANAPGPGEFGEWSTTGGADFSDPNDPNATVTDLDVGANTLTWTIRDIGLVCPGNSDDVIITYSDVDINGSADVLLDCFNNTDGTGTFTVTGGMANYTYTVMANTANATITLPTPGPTTSVSFTDAGEGVVTLRVQDGTGCTSQATITFTQPPVITIDNIITNNVDCNGDNDGSIDVNASGGTGALVYTISPGGTSNGTGVFPNLTAGTYTVSVTDANNCGPVVTGNINITEPPTITIDNIVMDNVDCFGDNDGSIDVNASGGTGALVYTISPGGTSNGTGVFNNLIAGTYTVSVTDANNCGPVVTGNINITEPPTITIDNIITDNVDCNGDNDGSIDVNASGGTGALVYTISPGGTSNGTGVFPNLTAGTYTVSVTDANNCGPVVTGNINITQPPTIVIDNIITANISCFGDNDGSIDVNASGGTGALVYTISPGGTSNGTGVFPNLTAGTYTVSVTDANNCGPVVTGNIDITQPPTITIDNIVTDNVDCNGDNDGSIDVNASGGTGALVYTISPGGTSNGTGVFNNLIAGTYTVSVTDANNCGPVVTGNINITEPPTITIDNIVTDNVDCFGDNDGSIDVNASGGTGALVYTISPGGTSNGTGVFNNLIAGTYTVSVTDANNCGPVVTGNINITEPPTITIDNIVTDNVDCFGDNDGSIDVNASGGTGALVYTISPGGTSNGTGIFPNLTAGTYTVSVTDANNCGPVVTGNIVITEPAQVSAAISGNASICVGQSATLTFTFVGAGPTWDFSYTDGSSTFNATANATPFNVAVNPVINTNYSLLSVTDATCGAGTVSGVATITVNPIPGNPAVFGNETWIGYVYDDSSLPAPPSANINFSGTKYRGFVDSNDIDNMTAASSYDVGTDVFELNLGSTAISGPNVCGSYLEDFSVRYRMRKTFAAGVYTFSVGADDGVRFFIDGVNVITDPNAFNIHSYTVYTTTAICLTGGQHDLVIEYFERGTDSRLTFDYSLVPAPTLNITSPVDLCVNSATPTLGVSTTDPSVIDFNWYTDSGLTDLVFTGANYTPGASELDMTVVGSADFFVTAVYAGGCESPESTVVVNVVNNAVLTLPPTDVCESGGLLDLTTIVSASPAGGTLTFTGTGVTGNDFDPTGLSGLVQILVDYTGSCPAPQGTLNLTVINSAAITAPATPVQVCESSADIDLNTLVSGSPAGGDFVFSGHPSITGDLFDPSTLSGIQTITVDYSVSGCVAPQTTFEIDVITAPNVVISNTSICENATTSLDLRTRVNVSPSGGTLTFAGAGVTGNFFNPSGLLGPVNITVTYTLTGCASAGGTLQVTVLDSSNGACTGGTGCLAFAASDPVIESRPTCSNQNDGQLIFNIRGGSGTYIVTLYDSTVVPIFTQAKVGSNAAPITFSSLSPSFNYFYKIDDGLNVCVLPYSLPVEVTVDASASGFVDAACFGEASGQATITVLSGGNAPYEYSLDGTAWTSFTSPHTITDLPPNGTYSILVRDDASDQCPDEVSVTIGNGSSQITIGLSATSATCGNNDGAINITTPAAGGGGGPYSYLIDGNTAEPNDEDVFEDLNGGNHILTVIDDATGCQREFPVAVPFPGFVTTSSISSSSGSCSAGGTISFFISSPGAVIYEVGFTTDFFSEPTNYSTAYYTPPINPGDDGFAQIPNLPRGDYYIWVRSTTAQCPTRINSTPESIGGPYAVTFSIGCRETNGDLALMNITGAPGIPFTYEIFGTTSSTGTITLDPLSNAVIPGFATGAYQVRLSQDQTATAGCVVTTPFTAAPSGSLDIIAVDKQVSFPEQPTGSMVVKIQESGAEPYLVWLVIDPEFFSDTVTAVRNPITFEAGFDRLWAGTYSIFVEDARGCRKEITEELGIDEEIFIPNIFTPNGDNINDTFYVRNLPDGSKLSVTNRWGKEVYSSGNYNLSNLWDGGGTPDGIYFYRLQIKGGSTYSGWVEILRGTK